MKLVKTDLYLLLINEEAEIKEGVYYLTHLGNVYKETSRPFEEDEEVERFTNRSLYKPILAYYPLTKEAKKLDLPLLPNPFKKEVDESFIKEYVQELIDCKSVRESERTWISAICHQAVSKATQSKGQYSLEDINKAIEFAFNAGRRLERKAVSPDFSFVIYREELIQSLSTRQLPKEFISEYEYKETLEKMDELSDKIGVTPKVTKLYKTLKTITNSDGKQEIQGHYIW